MESSRIRNTGLMTSHLKALINEAMPRTIPGCLLAAVAAELPDDVPAAAASDGAAVYCEMVIRGL